MYSGHSNQSGHAPQSSHTDLQDYYDTVPAPHRFSNYNSTPTVNRDSFDNDTPLTSLHGGYREVPTGHYAAEALAEHDNWREKANEPVSRRRKWGIFIIVGAVIVIAAVAIAIGVVVTQHKNSGGKRPNIGDPTKFTKDPALKQVFWGMSYTPPGSQMPQCGNKLGVWHVSPLIIH